MELLATVHWIVSHDPRAGDASHVTELVQHWNARQGRMFTRDHVDAALRHLHAYTWLFPDESTN